MKIRGERKKMENNYTDFIVNEESLNILKKNVGDNLYFQSAIFIIEQSFASLNLAISQLHGKCSVCTHYTAYHRQGKCKNCCWDNANSACLREYQDDNWEWKGFKNND